MKKRIISFVSVTVFIFTAIIGRLGYIVLSDNYTASEGYNSYSVTVAADYPTLYYSDCTRMTNNVSRYAAVIKPTANCIAELPKIFTTAEVNSISEELKSGYPVVKIIDTNPKTKYIKIIKVCATDSNKLQIISSQSSGLQKYMKNEMGKITADYSIDALGRMLSGDQGEIKYNSYHDADGYILTIDKKVQAVTELACKNMTSGCAIVMEVNSGKILSCVTKPGYSYLNKPLSNYAVGSIFKIVVALCAIENNVDLKYKCNGNIKVGDTEFSCSNKFKHGYEHLKEGLANSCNCYFINLALHLGEKKLLHTAKQLGFNETTELFDGWIVKNASLPTHSDLNSSGQLSLFGFGQGKLTVSPFQMCSTLCTIGNYGLRTQPFLVQGTVDSNGKKSMYSIDSNRVVNKDNAKKLLSYLRYVVTDGTGRLAESSDRLSSGKTATAQTGQFEDGKELLNTWFGGLYPYDNPKYAIVVMTERGTSGSKNCCPIFRTIVENL